MSDQTYKITKDGKPFLEGKNVLVNGLSADMGYEIGKALLKNGANVAGTFNENKENIEKLEKEFNSKDFLSFQLDLTSDNSEKEIEKIVAETTEDLGEIDVLLNVSGIWMIKPFLYESEEDREKIWKINYEGVVHFCQKVIRQMLSDDNKGEIINISSTGGNRGAGQQSAYCATKAALTNLTKSLAEEFGPRGIKVNAISPGPSDTKGLENFLDEVSKELMVKNIPRTRLCYPEDVANAVLSVLMNDYMTGSNIVLHGGKL